MVGCIYNNTNDMLLATVLLQGAIVMMPLLPFGLCERNYGADVLQFKPQRWLAAADNKTAAAAVAPAGSAAARAAAAARAGATLLPPDPLTFHTGQRDW